MTTKPDVAFLTRSHVKQNTCIKNTFGSIEGKFPHEINVVNCLYCYNSLNHYYYNSKHIKCLAYSDNVLVLRTFRVKYLWVSVMMCTTYFQMVQEEKASVYGKRERQRKSHVDG